MSLLPLRAITAVTAAASASTTVMAVANPGSDPWGQIPWAPMAPQTVPGTCQEARVTAHTWANSHICKPQPNMSALCMSMLHCYCVVAHKTQFKDKIIRNFKKSITEC